MGSTSGITYSHEGQSFHLWGKIPLTSTPEHPYMYTAVGTCGVHQYRYCITDRPNDVDIYKVYSVSKCVVDGPGITLLPFASLRRCDDIHSICLGRGPVYTAFRVYSGEQSIVITTEGSIGASVPCGARLVPLYIINLLQQFMCSYRFDILEYLAELGITL